jgi:anti-anti-sigma factor
MVERGELAAGPGPRLAVKQEGAPMFSVDLSTRECGGHVVVALRGELDIADAAAVAAALAAVAAREPQIIVDLSGLEFIDCSGVAALARGRKHARRGSACCGSLHGLASHRHAVAGELIYAVSVTSAISHAGKRRVLSKEQLRTLAGCPRISPRHGRARIFLHERQCTLTMTAAGQREPWGGILLPPRAPGMTGQRASAARIGRRHDSVPPVPRSG